MSRYSEARTNALIGSGVSAQDFKTKIADYRAAVSAESKSRILSDLHAMLAGCGVAADGRVNIDETEKLAEAVYPEIPADGKAAAAGLWQKLALACDRYPSPADFIAKLTDDCACPFYKYEDSLRLRLLKQILATVNAECKRSQFLSERFSSAYGDRDPEKIAVLDESVFSALETELTEAEDLRLLAEQHTFLPPVNADGKELLYSIIKNADPGLAAGFAAEPCGVSGLVGRLSDKALAAPAVWNGEETTVAGAIRAFLQAECAALTDSFAVRKELAKAMAAAEKETVPDFAERFSRYIESVSSYLLDPSLQPEIEEAIKLRIEVPDGMNAYEELGNIIGGDPKFNTVLNTLVSEFYNVNGLEESYSAATGKGSFSRQKIIAEALKHENAEITEFAAAKIRDAGYDGIIKESGEIDFVFLDKSARACDGKIKSAMESFKAALNDVVNKAEDQRRQLQQAGDLYRAAKTRMEREKRDPVKGLADWLNLTNRLADPSTAWNTITRDELFALAFAFNLRFWRDTDVPEYDRRRDVEEALYLRYYTENMADLVDRAPVKRVPDFRDRNTAVYLYFLAAGDAGFFGADSFRESGDRFVKAAELIADLDSLSAGRYAPEMNRQAFAGMMTDEYGRLADPYTFTESLRKRYTLEQKPPAATQGNEIGKNEAALRRLFCRRFYPYANAVKFDLNKTSIIADAAAASGASGGSEFIKAVRAIASGLFGVRKPDPDKLTRADVISVYFSAFASRTKYPNGVSFADLCDKEFAPGLNAVLSGCGFGLFSAGRFADAVTAALVYVYMNSLYGAAPAGKEQEKRASAKAPAPVPAQKRAVPENKPGAKADGQVSGKSDPAKEDKSAEPENVKKQPAEPAKPAEAAVQKTEPAKSPDAKTQPAPAKSENPAKKETPADTGAPAKARPMTEAELLKSAKFGVKIIPAAKPAERQDMPETTVKPDEKQETPKTTEKIADQPKAEADILKKFRFGEKIVPEAKRAAAQETKTGTPVQPAEKKESAVDNAKADSTTKPAEKSAPVKTTEKTADQQKAEAKAKPAEKQAPVKTTEKTSGQQKAKANVKPAEKQDKAETTVKASGQQKAKAKEKPAEKSEPPKTTEKTSGQQKAKAKEKPAEKQGKADTTVKASGQQEAKANVKPAEKQDKAETTVKTSGQQKAKAKEKPAEKSEPPKTTEKTSDKPKSRAKSKTPAGKAGAKAEPSKKQAGQKKPTE